MASSFTEIILIGGALLLGFPMPLLPAQILWVNLVADSFPNIGLTMEKAEKGLMRQKPRPRGEPVLNRDMLILIFIIGIVADLILFALYGWLLSRGADVGRIQTMMFAAVGISSLIYVFAIRSFRHGFFQGNPFSNPTLLLGVSIGFGLMALALFAPFFQNIFEIESLTLSDLLLLLMMGLIKLVAIELTKGVFLLRARL
jgi:Ca2+-transporting ATPase